jgi:hypothetical protein|tara:strand:- start:217 stop:762 length:546 start_codon:yes stop_codon:yes gene_type:complete
MNPKNEVDEKTMKDYDWKGHIRNVHGDLADNIQFLFPNNPTETFLTAIWKISIDVLEGKEVHVIVDGKDDLYISSGSPVFVSFEWHEDELTNGAPMCLPIKSYIRTGTYGLPAFVDENDWRTIRSGSVVPDSYIVLGNNEYLVMRTKNEQDEEFSYLAKKVYYGLLTDKIQDDRDKLEEWK